MALKSPVSEDLFRKATEMWQKESGIDSLTKLIDGEMGIGTCNPDFESILLYGQSAARPGYEIPVGRLAFLGPGMVFCKARVNGHDLSGFLLRCEPDSRQLFWVKTFGEHPSLSLWREKKEGEGRPDFENCPGHVAYSIDRDWGGKLGIDPARWTFLMGKLDQWLPPTE